MASTHRSDAISCHPERPTPKGRLADALLCEAVLVIMGSVGRYVEVVGVLALVEIGMRLAAWRTSEAVEPAEAVDHVDEAMDYKFHHWVGVSEAKPFPNITAVDQTMVSTQRLLSASLVWIGVDMEAWERDI